MPNRDEFPHVFEELKKILQSHVPPLVATTDTPDNYYLNTAVPIVAKPPPCSSRKTMSATTSCRFTCSPTCLRIYPTA
jgi:hypothetical protein